MEEGVSEQRKVLNNVELAKGGDEEAIVYEEEV